MVIGVPGFPVFHFGEKVLMYATDPPGCGASAGASRHIGRDEPACHRVEQILVGRERPGRVERHLNTASVKSRGLGRSIARFLLWHRRHRRGSRRSTGCTAVSRRRRARSRCRPVPAAPVPASRHTAGAGRHRPTRAIAIPFAVSLVASSQKAKSKPSITLRLQTDVRGHRIDPEPSPLNGRSRSSSSSQTHHGWPSRRD